MPVVVGIAVVIIALLGLGAFGSLLEKGNDCTSNAAKGFAMVFVQDEAEKHLYAPHTADFDLVEVKYAQNHDWRVKYIVDSKNVYGGPVRNHVNGLIKCIPTDKERKWKMVSFNMR